jgi:hypothetical protein
LIRVRQLALEQPSVLSQSFVLCAELQQPLAPTVARCKWKELIPQTMLMYYQPRPLGDVPSPRAAHTATVIGTHLYVFAGNDGQHLFNDLYVLDTGIRSHGL